MSAAQPLPEPVDPRTMDHFVYLHLDWQGYQQLLARAAHHLSRGTCRAHVAIALPRARQDALRKLGVREVRFYERGTLRFFALRREAGDDVYREIPRSELLPPLPVEILLSCMKEPDQAAAVRALRTALAPSGR